jgi:hypothetical protein
MAHGTSLPPVAPKPQQVFLSDAWDVTSQLQQTQQWEADGLQLRRPFDFRAQAAQEAAPQ